MKLPLSDRLLACAGFVKKGSRVADVGCDHGYLSLYLLENGIASSVIASDVNEGPLKSAMANARKFSWEKQITFCLSDGLKNLPRDFDTLVCAGMGADTMMSIISDAYDWLADPKYTLILQCQSKRPELRQWLYDKGFYIRRETLAKDGKFVYSIMEVVFDPGHPLSHAESYISPALLEDKHPLLPEYYERVKHGVELTVMGMRRSGDDQLHVYEVLLSALNEMEEQIYGNRS